MEMTAHRTGRTSSHRGQAHAGRARDQRDDDARRDIVSGKVLPRARLLRFAAAPDGTVVPDVAGQLPGRGLWVEATRAAVTQAVTKKLFSRAAKQPLHATDDLADRAERALVQRMLNDLGLARRSGMLVLGFDQVSRALGREPRPRVLIEAFDGAPDGKRKLFAAAYRQHLSCVTIESLASAELGLALGLGNVIHAAIHPGGLAERLVFDAERLIGFRPPNHAANLTPTGRIQHGLKEIHE
jgi:predicted RNA-binding protein YlxR (DUF448 family)